MHLLVSELYVYARCNDTSYLCDCPNSFIVLAQIRLMRSITVLSIKEMYVSVNFRRFICILAY